MKKNCLRWYKTPLFWDELTGTIKINNEFKHNFINFFLSQHCYLKCNGLERSLLLVTRSNPARAFMSFQKVFKNIFWSNIIVKFEISKKKNLVRVSLLLMTGVLYHLTGQIWPCDYVQAWKNHIFKILM